MTHRSLVISLCFVAVVAARPAYAQGGGTSCKVRIDVTAKGYLDATKWDDAIKVAGECINERKNMNLQDPEQRDVLMRAYEIRARAYLSLKTPLIDKAHADFQDLIAVDPDFTLTEPVSEDIRKQFEAVWRVLVGRLSISILPADQDIEIQGKDNPDTNRKIHLDQNLKEVKLVGGEYEIRATRKGYADLIQPVRVRTGDVVTEVKLVMKRETSTLEVTTVPADTEVALDKEIKRVTAPLENTAPPRIDNLQNATQTKAAIAGSVASAPALFTDLVIGPHTLTFRRPCYEEVTRPLLITDEPGKPDSHQPGDIRLPEFKMTPATATMTVKSAPKNATLFFDGQIKNAVPAEPVTICAGNHWIEVRTPLGRFMDKREWKKDDAVTIEPAVRSAFAIINVESSQKLTETQLRLLDELKDSRTLIYVPFDKELAEATKTDKPTDFWTGNASGTMTRAGKLDSWSRLATALGAQGLAAFSAGDDDKTVRLSLLAPDSSTPDNIVVNVSDRAVVRDLLAVMAAGPMKYWRPSLDIAFVDVDRGRGAAVVRVSPTSAAMGKLSVGEVIVSADGAPVTNAADLMKKVAGKAPGATLRVEVKKNGAPEIRPVELAIVAAPDADVPPGLLNVSLVDLRAALQNTAAKSTEHAAAQLNLAIAQYQLGNYEEAMKAYDEVPSLGDGPGVSNGTVAYLKGLCLEKRNLTQQALEQLAKAIDAPLARLSVDGPLVAPLAKIAQERIQAKK